MNAQRELFMKKTKKEDGEKRKIKRQRWAGDVDMIKVYYIHVGKKSNAIFLIMKRGDIFKIFFYFEP